MSTVHALKPESRSRRKILVLAQDEAVRDVLTHWLAAEGDDVHAFADGGSAARWLDGGAADVMITDRAYPAWNGLGTLQAVKQRFPAMRVVVAGIAKDDPFQSLAGPIGADAVVHAPLRKASVLSAILG